MSINSGELPKSAFSCSIHHMTARKLSIRDFAFLPGAVLVLALILPAARAQLAPSITRQAR
jgi:hypothetical protein